MPDRDPRRPCRYCDRLTLGVEVPPEHRPCCRDCWNRGVHHPDDTAA